jgi:hypothetical protein
LVQRLPWLPMLVRRWPQGVFAEATRLAIGADCFAASFRTVLKSCKSAGMLGRKRKAA